MSKQSRRGGLGRGLGALIPTGPAPAGPASTGPTPAGPADAQAAAEPGRDGAASTPAAPPLSRPVGSAVADHIIMATDRRPGPLPVPGATFAELDVAAISPNPRQPRQVFDEDTLAELAHSIREFGVLQPVVVRAKGGGNYELVMGERRLRAAAAVGLKTIPAIVRETADDAMLRDALLENVHRTALNPLEEAAAYQQLLDEFGATHEDLAQRIGRSRSQITNTIRLMNLPVPVQRRVAAGVLTAGHARALLALDDHERQEELASRIVAEGLSVRATEELAALAAHEASPTRRRKPAGPRATAPAIAELAEKLSDTLDTRVRVDLGRRKGKITVEFASVDDLERIVAVIAPQLATNRPDTGTG